MAERALLNSKPDAYGGIIVDSEALPQEIPAFAMRLSSANPFGCALNRLHRADVNRFNCGVAAEWQTRCVAEDPHRTFASHSGRCRRAFALIVFSLHKTIFPLQHCFSLDCDGSV